MITASIESLCAIAHTPTAKTLKFDHVKDGTGHTILPLKETHNSYETDSYTLQESYVQFHRGRDM